MELKNKNVLVFGTGISGIGADDLLEKVGANVILYDGNEDTDPALVRAKLTAGSRARILIGSRALTDEILDSLDLAVLSPGVPTDIPDVRRIREKNVRIWGEVELAYENGKGDVLAVTGTNGKTTTTTLLYEIMKEHAKRGTDPFNDQAFAVGNIGNPYTEESFRMTEHTVSCCEISSFQLETIDQFHPRVSAITNITPDHLNRHHTMEEYIRVKERIAENQTRKDAIVLNYEDPVLREFGGKLTNTRVIFFSSRRVLPEGISLNGDVIQSAKDGKVTEVVNVKDQSLVGLHNYENIMTAAAMAIDYGVPIGEIHDVICRFKAVEHRIEFVAEKQGVVYYNDSKGTNPDAAIRGIQAMNRPTILIGGGFDKHNEYDEWIRSFGGKVKKLVLIGQTREAIRDCAVKNGFPEKDIILCDTFEECFDTCVRNAQKGDAVLLSPACASWGMFPNYEVRGKMFKDMVNKLPD